MSPNQVAKKLSISKSAAQQTMNDFFRRFRRVKSWMEETKQSAGKINVPILMQVAGDDRIVDAKTSRFFFESLTAEDKTLYFYDGLYHEIYNELNDHRQQVLNDLEDWVDAHV